MSNVIYFNITYRCNNKCVFCFSNSTGTQHKDIPLNEFEERLSCIDIQKNDLIVINGGEPSIHPQFFEIIDFLCSNFESRVIVYSNGKNIVANQIDYKDKIKFVIPIHGAESMHDAITRAPNSYRETIKTLLKFELLKQKYAIKFILNKEMIVSNFDIYQFLTENNLNPEEIIFARLNSTDKGKLNNVEMPEKEELILYIESQIKRLSTFIKIKFLDIPFCYLNGIPIDMYKEEKPVFFFNDYDNVMIKTNYYKDLLVTSSCTKCKWYKLCEIMGNSYLTLSYNQNLWRIERE